jgi:hypothetical protein
MRLNPKFFTGFNRIFLFAGPNFADTSRTHQEYANRITPYGPDGQSPLT